MINIHININIIIMIIIIIYTISVLVYYGLVCFTRFSSCQGSPKSATLFAVCEESMR